MKNTLQNFLGLFFFVARLVLPLFHFPLLCLFQILFLVLAPTLVYLFLLVIPLSDFVEILDFKVLMRIFPSCGIRFCAISKEARIFNREITESF